MLLYLNYILLLLISLFFIVFFVFSLYEKEWRAAFVSFIFLVINFVFWISIILLNSTTIIIINYIVVFFVGVFILLSLINWFPTEKKPEYSNVSKYDERDHMFSRNNLQYYPYLFKQYYKQNPEKLQVDKKIHSLPELSEKGSKFYDSYFSPLPDVVFKMLDKIAFLREGESIKQKKKFDSKKMKIVLKKIAKFYGASDIGITELKNKYIYSYHGRQPKNWGKRIENNHKVAIVIIAKMDVDIIKNAPTLPVLLESSKKYFEAAKIAHIIAGFIRRFGYDAKSHIDGHYDVICAPIAEEAGLGEIGRMSIFMHYKYGPCVRISIVTTDMPVENTKKKWNQHIENFCKICKKCAMNCPSKAIMFGEKKYSRGYKHWHIKQEKCYGYWKTIGSDCAFCIRSCPFTKPNNLLHNLVRLYVSKNILNQKIALFMDNLFYGRKFKVKKKNPDLFKII